MDAVSLGKAGLQGWRARVGDAVAGPIAQRSPLTEDQVRAAVGGLFFVSLLLILLLWHGQAPLAKQLTSAHCRLEGVP